MAEENIISVSSAAAESDPGNAENFLLGILPVSLPYSIFPYHTPGFPSILRVSLPYPLFPYHTSSFSRIPYHTSCILPYHIYLCFPCDKLVAFNEMETLHTPIIRAQSHSSCMVVQFSLVRETHAQPSDKVV